MTLPTCNRHKNEKKKKKCCSTVPTYVRVKKWFVVIRADTGVAVNKSRDLCSGMCTLFLQGSSAAPWSPHLKYYREQDVLKTGRCLKTALECCPCLPLCFSNISFRVRGYPQYPQGLYLIRICLLSKQYNKADIQRHCLGHMGAFRLLPEKYWGSVVIVQTKNSHLLWKSKVVHLWKASLDIYNCLFIIYLLNGLRLSFLKNGNNCSVNVVAK